MDPKLRKRGWLIVGSFLAVLVYLVLSHHIEGAGFVGCPFRWGTGFSCFGCGMTRSTAHFIHGEWDASLRFHPLGGVFAVAYAVAAVHHLVQNLRGVALDYTALRWWRRIELPALIATAVFLLIFGLVRFGLEVSGILTPI